MLSNDQRQPTMMEDGRTDVVLLWEARATSEQNVLVLAGGAQATSSEQLQQLLQRQALLSMPQPCALATCQYLRFPHAWPYVLAKGYTLGE
jgi:hypothetical protein